MAVLRCLRGNRLFGLELRGEEDVERVRRIAHRVTAALGASRGLRTRFAAAVYGLAAELVRRGALARLSLHLVSGRRDGWLCARVESRKAADGSRDDSVAVRLAGCRPELARLVDRFEPGDGAVANRVLMGVRLRHLRAVSPDLLERLQQALAGVQEASLIGEEIAALRRRLELPHLHDPATGLLRREHLEHLVARRYERLLRGRGGFALVQLLAAASRRRNGAEAAVEADELLGDLADALSEALGAEVAIARAGPRALLLLLPGADDASAPVQVAAGLGPRAIPPAADIRLQVAVPRVGEGAPLFLARSRRLFATDDPAPVVTLLPFAGANAARHPRWRPQAEESGASPARPRRLAV